MVYQTHELWRRTREMMKRSVNIAASAPIYIQKSRRKDCMKTGSVHFSLHSSLPPRRLWSYGSLRPVTTPPRSHDQAVAEANPHL